MAIVIGSNGLANVDLIIPQKTSIYFTVVVKDEESGEVVDYSSATPYMKMVPKTGEPIDLDEFVTVAADKISVSLPATSTTMPTGRYSWDLMMKVSNTQTDRICYGMTTIVDTYAMDGE